MGIREDETGVSTGLQNRYRAANTVHGRFDSCPLGQFYTLEPNLYSQYNILIPVCSKKLSVRSLQGSICSEKLSERFIWVPSRSKKLSEWFIWAPSWSKKLSERFIWVPSWSKKLSVCSVPIWICSGFFGIFPACYSGNEEQLIDRGLK